MKEQIIEALKQVNPKTTYGIMILRNIDHSADMVIQELKECLMNNEAELTKELGRDVVELLKKEAA